MREVTLAKQFGVSRTPVNRALKDLAEMGLVEHIPNRGFFLGDDATRLVDQLDSLNNEDETYLALARDALDWGNGATLTIADLANRYNGPRHRIQKIVDRAALEGWISRGSGYKWIITLGISSEEDYAKFYRFREVVEPAAILEPGFHADQSELSSLLSVQERLAAGKYATLNAIDLFEINTELHETIVSWSGNVFFLDGLRRSNASRRLIEYTKVLNTHRIDVFARDHINLLLSLKAGKTDQAARQMFRHIRSARKAKTGTKETKAAPSR